MREDTNGYAIAQTNPSQRAKIDVRGIVQGVNFRAEVAFFAYQCELYGEVKNDPNDKYLVHMIAEGKKSNIDTFVNGIKEMKPSPTSMGGMEGFKSMINVKSIKEHREEITEPQSNEFNIVREDNFNTQEEILKNISFGGMLYSRFYHDHNTNFDTLDRKYDTISSFMKSIDTDFKTLTTWIKVGVIGLIASMLLYISVQAVVL